MSIINETKPKVSVCVVTYNQEKYIRQCLQSLVEQETDFLFEVIVSDDCSTDRTRTIVQDFATKYPGVVKPIFNKNNIGAFKNFLLVHENATGEYIAHMDGDDYALPGKLQQQADFIDEHEDCTVVFHVMKIVDGKSNDFLGCTEKQPILFDVNYLIQNCNPVAHSSKMYRKSAVITKWSEKPIIDFYMNVEHAISGKVGFIDTALGVYRWQVGVTADKNYDRMEKYNNDVFDRAIELGVVPEVVDEGRRKLNNMLAINYFIDGDDIRFKKYISINKQKLTIVNIKNYLYYIFRNNAGLLRKLLRVKSHICGYKNI